VTVSWTETELTTRSTSRTSLLSTIILALCASCSTSRDESELATESSAEARPETGFDDVLVRHRAVAHALGGIDGVDFSNSLQAVRHSLELGFRLFEVDLELDTQGRLICFHSGSEDQISFPENDPTRGARPLYAGRFDVITGTELFELMTGHPDMYLILDTRERDNLARLLRQAVEEAMAVEPALLERLIPHFYNATHLQEARAVYPFHRFIWKLPDLPDEEIIAFAEANSVAGVVFPPVRFNPQLVAGLRAVGTLPYVHTVNRPAVIEVLLANDVHGIYTDFDTSLLPPRVP